MKNGGGGRGLKLNWTKMESDMGRGVVVDEAPQAPTETVKRKTMWVVVGTSTMALAAAHLVIPTEPHEFHAIHILLRQLFFLPPILAAGWIGFRATIISATVISAFFVFHAMTTWPGETGEQLNQVGELAGFWIMSMVAGILFQRQRLSRKKLEEAHKETLAALATSLDLRESGTYMHSQRVRDYAVLLAEEMGLPAHEIEVIAVAALLHDIGKIAIPDSVLLKNGPLDPEEWKMMRRHPEEGCRLIAKVAFLGEAAVIVRSHHEHVDGSGYPDGLKGSEIPLGARLFAVVDAYDAVTSVRPYRHPLSHEDALSVLEAAAGGRFDADVVALLRKIPYDRLKAAGGRAEEESSSS